jgi:small nuclear ribonucleoprotein (snRNP)-like protein
MVRYPAALDPPTYQNSNLTVLFTSVQLPLGLLNAAQGHPMLVELKNGETLNGHLVLCDTWMNLTLREVVQTSPVRPPSFSSSRHVPSPRQTVRWTCLLTGCGGCRRVISSCGCLRFMSRGIM